MNAVLEQISKIGIVPVVKIDNAADALPLAKALCAGGLPCAEVTFRTSAAAEAIKIMTDNFPSMCVGAGTVLNEFLRIAKPHVRAVRQAGNLQQLTVQVHVGALHCAVAGNIGGDDRLHASFGTAAAESNARFGGNFFPAVHSHKAIAHVHANGNFGAVFLRHAGGKIKILYGNGAQDAAPHAERKILFNAGFVTFTSRPDCLNVKFP